MSDSNDEGPGPGLARLVKELAGSFEFLEAYAMRDPGGDEALQRCIGESRENIKRLGQEAAAMVHASKEIRALTCQLAECGKFRQQREEEVQVLRQDIRVAREEVRRLEGDLKASDEATGRLVRERDALAGQAVAADARCERVKVSIRRLREELTARIASGPLGQETEVTLIPSSERALI